MDDLQQTPAPSRAFVAREGADSREIAVLAELAQALAGEFRLEPLLEKIVTSAAQLLGCSSGSICTVDAAAKLYRKEVDLAVVCRAGGLFPLDEGVTGAVLRAGATVVFDDYADVPGGHISPDDGRFHRAVLGVPIVLQSAIIGALIIFAEHDDARFTAEDAALIELFATHAAIAIANSRLHTRVAERTRAAAIAQERQRTLFDVHDTVGRAVAGVMLHLGDAVGRVDAGADPRPAIADASAAAAAALDLTRVSALGGRQPSLDAPALERRIAQELEWVAGIAGVRTQLLVVGERRPIGAEAAGQLLHIVQEALTNVATHSRAHAARAGLVYGPESVSAIIEDDGVGFDVTRMRAAQQDGARVWGLRGLVSRAGQLGGSVHISSTPSWGTRIEASLPYDVVPADARRPARWRILVAHRRPVVRAGVVRLLAEAEPDIQVVGEIGDAGRAEDAVGLLRPDVVLAELDLPGLEPDAFLRGIAAADAGVGVVFLVGSSHDPRIRDAAQAGARGFIDDGMDGVALSRALISAASGDAMVSGALLDALGAVGASREDALTAREREVHRLVAGGLPDKQIAAALAISVKTVEKHVGTILRKTGARNRTVLAALAGAAAGASGEGNPYLGGEGKP